MFDLIIRNAIIVNESKQVKGSVGIQHGKIAYVGKDDEKLQANSFIDAAGLFLIPGVIDDQVHFREPGYTHKADIWHESRAAAAGGVTSFMEMPNTNPQTVTQDELKKKFELGAKNSLVNYSFYFGATNENIDELLKTDKKTVCGIKIFMGSSTGNMLVDNVETLAKIFSNTDLPVAVHCEDEQTIRANIEKFKQDLGDDVPIKYHPIIRSEEACYKSSSLAVELATKYGTRLHILHISTARELDLFQAGGNLRTKQITSEVCIHHLWFNDADYDKYGSRIKWNPAVKTKKDQEALFKGLLHDKLDVIATDHAPHTVDEKGNTYFKAPSGGPLIQHSLVAMLEFQKQEKIAIEDVVRKMCHAPAEIFQIEKRGRRTCLVGVESEGYWADLVLVDPKASWKVEKENILAKCGWSPFEGETFHNSVHTTFVNGSIVYRNGKIEEKNSAMSLTFMR